MKNKAVSGIMLTLLFTSMLTLTFSVQSEDPAPDLSIEGIMMPYLTPLYYPQIDIIYRPPPFAFGYQINATVANEGTADAGSFNVSFSAYWEEEEVPEVWQTETIPSLEQGMTETVSFYFIAENYGNYTLIIMADCDDDVAELDETNNVKMKPVIGTAGGDINGDGDVDFDDFVTFAAKYGNTYPFPPYPTADVNWDGTVDFNDFITFAANYGKTVF